MTTGGGNWKNNVLHVIRDEDPPLGMEPELDPDDPYDARPVAVVNPFLAGMVSVGGGGGGSGRHLDGAQQSPEHYVDRGCVPSKRGV